MPKILTFKFIIFIVCLNLSSKVYAADNEVVTNEMIKKYFHKSQQISDLHAVMVKQKGRLSAILDGFILGDTEKIQREANNLSIAMQEVASTFIPKQGQEATALRAMSEIVSETDLLQETAKANAYDKAYGHFTRLTAQCIKCHQVAREWGKLPEPEPTPEASKPADKISEKQIINKSKGGLSA